MGFPRSLGGKRGGALDVQLGVDDADVEGAGAGEVDVLFGDDAA